MRLTLSTALILGTLLGMPSAEAQAPAASAPAAGAGPIGPISRGADVLTLR